MKEMNEDDEFRGGIGLYDDDEFWKNEKCLREYREGGQTKLSSSHEVCYSCSNFRFCPDPTVKKLSNRV